MSLKPTSPVRNSKVPRYSSKEVNDVISRIDKPRSRIGMILYFGRRGKIYFECKKKNTPKSMYSAGYNLWNISKLRMVISRAASRSDDVMRINEFRFFSGGSPNIFQEKNRTNTALKANK